MVYAGLLPNILTCLGKNADLHLSEKVPTLVVYYR